MAATSSLEYRALDRTVRIDGVAISLSPREAEALSYLHDRAGDVVSLHALETEVWGMAEGVRSRTVPVTMRKIRAKLGGAGSLLETVHGVGWRLNVVRTSALPIPKFQTPYHARPEEENALRKLIDSPWRVVTVVGPGGSGKSRLALEVVRELPGEVVYAALGGVRTMEDLSRVLLTAAGLTNGGFSALEASLALRGALLLLEEVDAVVELTRQALIALPAVRVLVTSRKELGLPEEATHAIKRLTGAAGQAFLAGRLEASRWGGNPTTEVMARAVALLDGLPLALELAAAHPEGLEALVAKLEQGHLPTGPEGERFLRTLSTSVEPLEPEARRVLNALALCDGPLPESEIVDWLGAESVHALRTLASHSLLERQQNGWSVLRTMRVYLLAQDADWEGLRGSFDQWLVKRAHILSREIYQDPSVGERWSLLIESMVGAIERIPVEALGSFVDALAPYYYARGPQHAHLALVRQAQKRAPNDLLLAMAAVVDEPAAVLDQLDAADVHEDPYVRGVAAIMRATFLVRTTSIAALETAAAATDDRLLRARIARKIGMLLSRTDAAAALKRLQADAVEYREFPLLVSEYRRNIGMVASNLGDERLALRSYEEALAMSRLYNIAKSEVHVLFSTALLHADRSTEEGCQTMREVGALAVRFGEQGVAGSAGMSLYAMEDLDGALSLLLAGESSPVRTYRALSKAFRLAIQTRRGHGPSRLELAHLIGEDLVIHRRDGSLAGEALAALLRGEATLACCEAERWAEEHARLVEASTAMAHPKDPWMLRRLRRAFEHRSPPAKEE